MLFRSFDTRRDGAGFRWGRARKVRGGRGQRWYQTECSIALPDEKTWVLRTPLLRIPSSPPLSLFLSRSLFFLFSLSLSFSLYSAVLPSSFWLRASLVTGGSGEKRARGKAGHAQLKGVNRPTVGAARRSPGYRRKSSPRGLLLETRRNNALALPRFRFPAP